MEDTFGKSRYAQAIVKKWQPLLDHKDFAPLTDRTRRTVTALMLENTQRQIISSDDNINLTSKFLMNETVSRTAGIQKYDPVLISLIRRTLPNLIAYDVCGVQPMTAPTGLVFALRARYDSQSGPEAFYNEANTGFSARGGMNVSPTDAGYANATVAGGAANNQGGLGGPDPVNFAGGVATDAGEVLGTGDSAWPQMATTIDRVTVTARLRALRADYTLEMAQDMQAVHGLNTEQTLTDILAAEIIADVNREIIRTIFVTARPGAQTDVTTPGVFDLNTDAGGRWLGERFKGLLFQVDREANVIARETRFGRGNIIICSSDVASALSNAGILSPSAALADSTKMTVDDTGNTFAGVLSGRYKVYIDPYAAGNYMVVGYRGSTDIDAGLFYCPYQPLILVKATDPRTMSPVLAFKTRYGVVANPFAEGTTLGGGAITPNTNRYYRRVLIDNLSGGSVFPPPAP